MSQDKDRLKQIRNALGISQQQLSKQLGIKNSVINHIESGDQKLSVQVAIILRDNIVQMPNGRLRFICADNQKKEGEAELRTDWLLLGEGDPFEKVIKNQNCFELTYKNETVFLPRGDEIEIYKITDDSMSPEFLQNDYIALDKSQKDIKNGGVYLINVFGDEVLRRVFRTGKSKIKVVSVNKDLIPPIEVEETDITIIGKYIYKVTIALS